MRQAAYAGYRVKKPLTKSEVPPSNIARELSRVLLPLLNKSIAAQPKQVSHSVQSMATGEQIERMEKIKLDQRFPWNGKTHVTGGAT